VCIGVVLKQAMITKKGKSSHNNVGKEALADPLVIPSNDLVKVVAKVRYILSYMI
jgi:hypothetical protein